MRCMMVRIGQETSDSLISCLPDAGDPPHPLQVCVQRPVKDRERSPTVKIAPVPEQIIPKSIAHRDCWRISLPRVRGCSSLLPAEKQFERLGVELNRTSMSRGQ